MDQPALQREVSALRELNEKLLVRIAELENGINRPTVTAVIELDLLHNTVRLSKGKESYRAQDQWVDFFALLSVKASEKGQHGSLQASELNTVGSWRAKKEASVGKEVTRFVRMLDGKGLVQIVESEGPRRQSWALNPHTIVNSSSNAGEISEHLKSLGWQPSSIPSLSSLPEFSRWIDEATRALMDLQTGEVDKAQQAAEKLFEETDDPLLKRTARLLGIRAIQRAGDQLDKADIDLAEYDQVRSWGVGPLARAFHGRAIALQKYWARPQSYEREIDKLRGLIVNAEAAGDIGAAGTLYGTVAVLSRRCGRFDDAEFALRRAIPLFLANGDVLNLQAALFNLGHVIERMVQKEGRHDYRLALSMLQLDRDLRTRFNLGVDSAQGEILMSLVYAELDPANPTAEDLLEEAKGIIFRNQSTYDQACWIRAQAKLIHRRAELGGTLDDTKVQKQIRDRLKSASRFFKRADRELDAKDTLQKMHLLENTRRAWPVTQQNRQAPKI